MPKHLLKNDPNKNLAANNKSKTLKTQTTKLKRQKSNIKQKIILHIINIFYCMHNYIESGTSYTNTNLSTNSYRCNALIAIIATAKRLWTYIHNCGRKSGKAITCRRSWCTIPLANCLESTHKRSYRRTIRWLC